MSARHTTQSHRVSKNSGGVINAFIDYCQFRMLVKINAWRDDGGNLHIKANNYPDWLLAKIAAREQFGFEAANVIREL